MKYAEGNFQGALGLCHDLLEADFASSNTATQAGIDISEFPAC